MILVHHGSLYKVRVGRFQTARHYKRFRSIVNCICIITVILNLKPTLVLASPCKGEGQDEGRCQYLGSSNA